MAWESDRKLCDTGMLMEVTGGCVPKMRDLASSSAMVQLVSRNEMTVMINSAAVSAEVMVRATEFGASSRSTGAELLEAISGRRV